MSNKSPQELRKEVRDRFAGLTGTYDGADTMADYVVEMLTSHMQTAFEVKDVFLNKGVHPEYHDMQMRRLETEWPSLYFAVRKLSSELGGDK